VISGIKIRFSKQTFFQKARGALEGVRGQLYIDANQDYRNTVFLAGSARGGTTWVAELINFDNSYRLIFEPLRVPLCRPFYFSRYLRPGDDDPTFVDPMRLVVSGRLRHAWPDRYNRQALPRKRLVKEITANLLLGWLHSQYPEMPIILLLRHPCAILNSQQRLGWKIGGVEGYLKQEALMSDFLLPLRRDMERASPVEGFFFRWCINTIVPLKQFRFGEIHLAFFENFCAQPRPEFARLFNFLQRGQDERVFKVLDRPSSQAWRGKEKLPSRQALVDGWREQLPHQTVSIARSVMRLFGLDSLYGEDGLPNVEEALKLFSG